MATTFKFTPEQLRQIYDGDIAARNAFYFDNLDIIKRMAYCAVQREQHPTVTVDDLIQGAYVDMDYFCHSVNRPVTDEYEIACFLRWSFHLAPYGGLAYCRENNAKITCQCGNFYGTDYTDNNPVRLDAVVDDADKHLQSDGTETYADYIADPRADFTEQSTDYTDEYVNTFAEYLTPKQRDVFALIADGYTDTQIAERLSITQALASQHKYSIRKTFGKCLPDVVNALASYDIYADGIADRTPKRTYKTDEKQRRRMAEYYRRKHTETPPHDVA